MAESAGVHRRNCFLLSKEHSRRPHVPSSWKRHAGTGVGAPELAYKPPAALCRSGG